MSFLNQHPRQGPDYTPGDWELDPIRFCNKQWAVTDYGIENVAGPYHYALPKKTLRGNLHHVGEKLWVDRQMFAEAYAKALEMHGADPRRTGRHAMAARPRASRERHGAACSPTMQPAPNPRNKRANQTHARR
jgi:hypothetical protein